VIAEALATTEAALSTITLGQIAVFGANLLILLGLVVKAAPLFRKLRDLADDWSGEPARPGVPARAGVMERLQVLDEKTAQLEHNGGSSLRDDVTAMRTALDEHIRTTTAERIGYWQALALVQPNPPAAPQPAPTDEKG
jgi:hypothetical protein